MSDPFVRGWLASHPLNRRVRVVESTRVSTPMARGFLNPSIVGPPGFLDLGQVNIQSALEHELAHIRRFDLVFKIVFLTVACLYRFNPLIWIAYRIAMRDIELACDESALRRLGDRSREGYALALLDAASLRRGMAGGVHFAQSSLEERIQSIVRPSALPITVAAVAGLLVGALSVGMAWCLSPSSLGRIELGRCSLEVPAAWEGLVEIDYAGNGVSVGLAGQPDMCLLVLVETPSTSGIASRSGDCNMPLWRGWDSEGTQYQLFGVHLDDEAMIALGETAEDLFAKSVDTDVESREFYQQQVVATLEVA